MDNITIDSSLYNDPKGIRTYHLQMTVTTYNGEMCILTPANTAALCIPEEIQKLIQGIWWGTLLAICDVGQPRCDV